MSASRARRSCTRKPVTTLMIPSAVSMPNPATRKCQAGPKGFMYAGSAAGSVRVSRRRATMTTGRLASSSRVVEAWASLGPSVCVPRTVSPTAMSASRARRSCVSVGFVLRGAAPAVVR